MLRCVVRIVAGLALVGILAPCAARAQTADHLKCYKVKDTALARLRGIVDADPPQFPPEASCKIAKAQLFCVPATKAASVTNGTEPIVELPYSAAPAPGDFICYKVACAKPVPPAQVVTDQFGTRTFEFMTPRLLCTPAVKGTAYCGDGVINGSEECEPGNVAGRTCVDEGFESGDLACGPDCKLDKSGCECTASCPDRCGDGIKQAGENCDGSDLGGQTCATFGFAGGSLGCTATCEYSFSGCTAPPCSTCGNNVKQPGENCDGTDLGGRTCASFGFARGALGCTQACEYEFSGCTTGSCASLSNTDSASLARSASQYLEAAPSCSLQLTGDLTVEAWIRLARAFSGAVVAVAHQYSGGENDFAFFYDTRDSNRTFHVELTDVAGTPRSCTVNVPASLQPDGLVPGTWYHLAFSYEAAIATVRVFLSDLAGLGADGQQVGTCTAMGTSLRSSTGGLRIGAVNVPPNYFFDGELDEVRIWASARQGQQILGERCCAPTGANLRAYWKFDGDSLLDASGHGNTLTNHGATFPEIVPQCP